MIHDVIYKHTLNMANMKGIYDHSKFRTDKKQKPDSRHDHVSNNQGNGRVKKSKRKRMMSSLFCFACQRHNKKPHQRCIKIVQTNLCQEHL